MDYAAKLVRWDRAMLGAALLLFIGVAGWYSVLIPAGEAVDEISHLEYVVYVQEHMALPIQPMNRDAVRVWVGHHPPLYYTLGALAISWTDTSDFKGVLRANPHFVWAENDDRNGWNVLLHFGQDEFPWKGAILTLHVMRFLSIVFGAIAVIGIYGTVRSLLPNHVWAPLGATCLMVYNPSFLFMASTVHHDVLLTAVYSLGLWWAVRAARTTLRCCDIWMGGLLAGAAMLTKLSGVTLLPVMALVLFLRGWISRDWKPALRNGLGLVAIAAVVSGWWYVRNQTLYGDPIGWRMFLTIHSHMVRTTPYTLGIFQHEFLGQLLRTFWGAFGYMHITFWQVTRYLWLLTGCAALGLLVIFVRWLVKHRSLSGFQIIGWVSVCAGFLLIAIAFVRFSVTTLGAGHGRYLFPAAAAMGGLFIVGLNGFADWRGERVVSCLLGLGMLGYGIWAPLQFAAPKYTALEQVTLSELEQTTAIRCDWAFGDAVRLVAYSIEPNLAMPDAWLSLHLYWQGDGLPVSRPDVYARANLVDETGAVLHSIEFWPAKSTTPSVWADDMFIVSHKSLHVPSSGYHGVLHIEITLTDGRKGAPLAVGGGGQVAKLGPILSVGEIAEVVGEAIPSPREEVLGASVAMAGYQLPAQGAAPGQPLVVRLFWRVLEPPPADYTVFIHVLDAQGHLVAQFDGPPGGNLPTTAWRPGQILSNSYSVPMPPGLPTGDYTVRMGLYTWPSLERLAISLHGVPAGDTVLLGSVVVKPTP